MILVDISSNCCDGRSPHGERGLKLETYCKNSKKHKSRSPHGERGLKFTEAYRANYDNMSLSSRRAWIEIDVGI